MGEGNTSKCNITCVGKFPNFAHLMEWGKIIGNIKNIIILSLSLSLSHEVNTLTIKKPCYLSPLCFALMFDVCKRKVDTIEDESRAF